MPFGNPIGSLGIPSLPPRLQPDYLHPTLRNCVILLCTIQDMHYINSLYLAIGDEELNRNINFAEERGSPRPSSISVSHLGGVMGFMDDTPTGRWYLNEYPSYTQYTVQDVMNMLGVKRTLNI